MLKPQKIGCAFTQFKFFVVPLQAKLIKITK